jgi:hypothetical protein
MKPEEWIRARDAARTAWGWWDELVVSHARTIMEHSLPMWLLGGVLVILSLILGASGFSVVAALLSIYGLVRMVSIAIVQSARVVNSVR